MPVIPTSTPFTPAALGRQIRQCAEQGMDLRDVRLGAREDGTMVVYVGRSYWLHPCQTRRAHAFLRAAELSDHVRYDSRAIRLDYLDTRLNPPVVTPAQDAIERGGEAVEAVAAVENDGASTSAGGDRGEVGASVMLPVVDAAAGAVDPVVKLSLPERKAVLGQRLGCSDHPVGLYAAMMRDVGPDGSDARYIDELPGSRFYDVPTARATLVVAPDGTRLSANRVSIDGVEVAIACQYPTGDELPAFFDMLVANRTPLLLVLASEADLDDPDNDLPPYFRQEGCHGKREVIAPYGGAVTLAGGLEVESYSLEVEDVDAPFAIPVLHVTNWRDFSARDIPALKALVEQVEAIRQGPRLEAGAGERGTAGVGLPVVHCRAGVGRSGQFLAAAELLKAGDCGLETIITDMRRSRSPLMVQTTAQLEALADLAASLGRPILAEEH
jgi:hypothetical protein